MAWWVPLVTTAAGLWAGSKDRDAIKGANKANEARFNQAMSMFGWFDQHTFTDIGPPPSQKEFAKQMIESEGWVLSHAGAGGLGGSTFGPAAGAGGKVWRNPTTGEVLSASQMQDRISVGYQNALAAHEAKAASAPQRPTLFGRQDELFDQAESAMRSSLGAVKGGFQKAEQLATTIGQQLSIRALEREKAALAGAVADMTSRGLVGSSVQQSFERGIRADTNRTLAEIGEGVAGMRSSLAASGGAALGSSFANLAQFLAGRAQAETSLGQSLINVLVGRNDVPGPSALAGLGGAEGLANLASAFANFKFPSFGGSQTTPTGKSNEQLLKNSKEYKDPSTEAA